MAGAIETTRKKRTITEIRRSKTTGEKMVYMSVPDYTSAKWAEMGGVDVAVVGDSLAMVAHGHPNTIPATMDMMILHSLAVRRGAPNTSCSAACPTRATTPSTGRCRMGPASCRMRGRRGQAPGRQEPGACSAGAGGFRYSDGVPYRPDAPYGGRIRRLQDTGPDGAGRHEDPGGRPGHRGCGLLHAGVRGGARPGSPG